MIETKKLILKQDSAEEAKLTKDGEKVILDYYEVRK